jgi:prepilin-type N-terminal cleavage/methylation domain-containing protein
MTSRAATQAFTLIELLIVVAIIAILASIAVPNFLEAQTRTKVSRAESDMRAISIGLEAYRIDFNRYPPTPMDAMTVRMQRLSALTTPVSFLSTIPLEVFKRGEQDAYPYWSSKLNDAMKFAPTYYHLNEEKRLKGRWSLFSRGPDMDYEAAVEEGGSGLLMYYDPTNGTTSNGDVMRFGP